MASTHALLTLVGLLLGLAAIGLSVPVRAETKVPPPQAREADMLVGAYYFPGWSTEDRWYCIKANPGVQHPLLGYYREGEPEVADWHIKWALEHGVSFFAFDYYIRDGAEALEAALDGFLKSDYVDRFRFCLNWCNHAAAETQNRAELEAFFDVALEKYLRHPSYLRIQDKPVVWILSGYSFVKTLGPEAAKQAFGDMEQRMVDAGLPGMYLVFCEGEILSEQAVKDSFAAGVDAFCLYNYPYAGSGVNGPGKYAEATYEHLIEQGRGLWQHWRNITGGRFWPTVMPGWDRRPWLKDGDLIRTGSTPELFKQSLTWARDHVNGDRVVMIEAWNEWGEGSILEPSEEYQFAYLDQVRQAFCPGSTPPKGVSPATSGVTAPCFPMELPAVSRWGFDHSVEGWYTMGASAPEHRLGAISATANSGDPQLYSPVTYLACDRFARLRLRMRLTPPVGATSVAMSSAQLFWVTTEHQWGEAQSVTFPVKLDGRWQTYEIGLRACPGWRGLTERLRLDPCDVEGTRVDVDCVELLP